MGYYNKVLSKVSKKELLQALGKIDTFILETDGVVYAGDKLLPNTIESITALQSLGKNILFYPNSSTRSRENFKQKLANFGIKTETEKIFTPSFITAEYLKRYHPEISKAYVVGKEGIKQELQLAGVSIVEVNDFEEHSNESSQILKNFDKNKEIGAVVVSFDESFSFKKLMLSGLLLERRDCLFVATNSSPYLMVDGKKYPGVGTLIASIKKLVNRNPDAITCRPNNLMVSLLKETVPNINLQRTCFVGHEIISDMKFSIEAGVLHMLVLSGVTIPQELEKIIHLDVNFILHSFGRIHEIINN